MNQLSESVGKILEAIQTISEKGQKPAQIVIGQVTVGSQSGLKVRCGGLELTTSDIWCNDSMLVGYSPKLEGQLPGSCPDGRTNTPVTKDQLTRNEFALNAGDRVVLATEDWQSFYLLCKVVRL